MNPKTTNHLHLGETKHGKPFYLPLDIATDTTAIIARKGAGKTYTARVIIEDLLAAGVQTVVIDPLDVCNGLRVGADGKTPGCDIAIFGGSRGDLPLLETAGKLLADVIVDRGVSAILVLDHLSQNGQRRFVTDFAERLFERKSSQEHRTPLTLVLDEADAFAPQRVMPEKARCLGAVDVLVRRGRSRGIGTVLITQRPATLSKDVLTQAEMLVCLQVTSPQDRDALTDWIEAKADPEQADTFLDSLAGLQKGQAWVWSPSLLQTFERVQVRKARTYDSSYTPRIGDGKRVLPTLRPIDLKKLQDDLASLTQEVQANDPAHLKKRIRELEHEVAKKATAVPAKAVTVTKEPRPQLDPQVVGQLIDLCQSLTDETAKVQRETEQHFKYVTKEIRFIGSQVRKLQKPGRVITTPADAVETKLQGILEDTKRATREYNKETDRLIGDTQLGKAERLILTALSQYEEQGRSKVQIALLTGYAIGGTFNNAIGRLNTLGYIGKFPHGAFYITSEGKSAVGDVEPLPVGRELVDYWCRKLGKAERMALEFLVEAWPNSKTKDEIAEGTGYAVGGTFNNALGRLRTLELIEGRGEMRVSQHIAEDL